MVETLTDIWAQWLLHRRHGGDTSRLQKMLARMGPIRDKVLDHVGVAQRDVLLDVGCGDGLIAFGALAKNPTIRVIFSDISRDLLDHARLLAHQMSVADRCEFLCASADDLSALGDRAVDAVTLRSVLIYVADKRRAFQEFARVLRPEGRLSIFEPINRFGEPQPAHMFWGFDVTPIIEVAGKVKTLYRELQPLDADPMMDFDERDLVAYAEGAGFRTINLHLDAEVKPLSESEDLDLTWDSYMRTAANPKIPTMEEALAEALSDQEAAEFIAYMRPLVESKSGTFRSAVAYLWARR
jgi:ubiquinone/menaquinone biosynthesis C-methylase UbiE